MKVVFINNTMETFTPTQSGALATIIWESCRVAQREGVEPTVITRHAEAAPFEWKNLLLLNYPAVPRTKIGVTAFRAERKILGWRHLRQRTWAQRVVRTIKTNNLHDHALILMNDPELAVVLRERFPKARIIHWFQNQLDCKQNYRRAFGGSANAVLGVSNFTSRWIENYYGLGKGTVRTVYNGVDCEQFRPCDCGGNRAPLVNFVGRTGIEKAPDLLLKACTGIAKKTSKFVVQIVGSNHWDRFELDDYQRELTSLVNELESLGVHVNRPGHVGRAALPEFLRQAQINVMPSRWDEPFGMTTIEGMATGLATIAARTGGTPEIVDGHGILFDRDSVDQLAAALEKLILDTSEREALRKRARERAQDFRWERVWTGLKEVMA
jgi:glycosyltransferase involved in cell wall biosynthesis